jgi:soluble lytic murein transglycosylase
MKGGVIWFSLLCLFLWPADGEGGIYGYRDKFGNYHLTDDPPNNRYEILLTTSKRPKGFKNPVATGWQYGDTVGVFAEQAGLNIPLLLAIIKTESNFNPRAVSPKGAMGLMQLMPAVCEKYQVSDPFDIRENIRAGSAYFREMLDRFKDVNLALAAYNAGPFQVESYRGVPPFDETRRYIEKVRWYFDYYLNKGGQLTLPRVSNQFKEGIHALQEDQPDRAAVSFQEVVASYPNSPESNYNLALVHERMGKWSAAISHYQRAIRVDPYFKEAYYNLAILFEKVHLTERAICTWEALLRYEVREEEIKEVRKYIEELRHLHQQRGPHGPTRRNGDSN